MGQWLVWWQTQACSRELSHTPAQSLEAENGPDLSFYDDDLDPGDDLGHPPRGDGPRGLTSLSLGNHEEVDSIVKCDSKNVSSINGSAVIGENNPKGVYAENDRLRMELREAEMSFERRMHISQASIKVLMDENNGEQASLCVRFRFWVCMVFILCAFFLLNHGCLGVWCRAPLQKHNQPATACVISSIDTTPTHHAIWHRVRRTWRYSVH